MSSATGQTALAPPKQNLSEFMGTLNYSYIAYIFVSIILSMTVISQIMASGRQWTSIIVGILFILIFVFFGTRWFSNGKMKGYYTGAWPPLINTCPDYLVYYNKSGTDTCVDLVGVNRSGGLLRSWASTDTTQNPPADDAKYFKYTYKPGMTNSQLQVLCDNAQKAGLTWEGITNGDSCTFNSPSIVLGRDSQSDITCKT
jgi:hypothetical protein